MARIENGSSSGHACADVDVEPARDLYQITDLCFEYRFGAGTVPALTGINLDIAEGDFLCFAGPSGSGKSTLLNVLGLIEPVTKERVRFLGRDVASLRESERNHIRRHDLGFIFQSFHLLPVLSAEENVEYFLHRQRIPRAQRKQRVHESLRAVGLDSHRHKRPNQMSGGEQQRVAIARAIAKRPRVIIADEPTASLDQATGHTIMQLLAKLNREEQITIIAASHDPMVIESARLLVQLRDGKLQPCAARAPVRAFAR